MNIPRFDDKDYTKCCSCGNEYEKEKSYISKKCLHKLCYKCYKNKFQIADSRFNCPHCKTEKESFELCQEDFSQESPLQIIYDEDLKKRNIIMQLVYKRRENFDTEEEYNSYLEYVEKCIQSNNINDIKKKYPQSEEEREENYKKRQKEMLKK